MSRAERRARAAGIVEDFLEETGVTSDRTPRRYLWTDALAACTCLGLHEETGEERWREAAGRLIDQVHHVLGRHREDDPREGWISGLGEEEGERRPTAGGLRIGKEEPERGPSEPYDPRAEWDRDGQYYHYLTRWAHALNRAWRVTGRRACHRWAVELMRAAHRGFVRGAPGGEGGTLVWKMSIDLSRPLVPTEGEHDPLDGLVTVRTIRAAAPGEGDVLREEEAELASLCRGRRWATDDPLGVGGLLSFAWWLARLEEAGRGLGADLVRTVAGDAAAGLSEFARAAELDSPAGYRLAFRELGLSVGLAAAERLLERGRRGPGGDPGGSALPPEVADRLEEGLPLRREIERFWLAEENREVSTWRDHRDINRVTLAASLAPSGYLDL